MKRKFTFLMAALFTLAFLIPPQWVMGQTRTENTVSWGPTQTSDLGSTISQVNGTATGTISTGSFSWNYTRTLKSGTDHMQMQSNNTVIQLGKNGGVENVEFTTSNIPGVIKSVSVECASYNGAHKVGITVGGQTYLSATNTSSWTTVGKKTGTGTSSGEIVISFTAGTRALYIKSISVTYETGGSSSDPVITITQPTGGTIAVSNNNTNVPSGTGIAAGTTLTLSNTPGDAYTFGSYSVYKTGDQSTTVTVTNGTFTMPNYNVTVTGTFNAKPTHTITLTQPTGGVGTIASNPSGSAYEGQTVTLTASEVSKEFTSWNVTGATVANQNSPTTTFTMGTQNVTVSATFTENPNVDFLNAQKVITAMSSNSGYNNWSNVTSNTGVKYSGQSNYSTSYIQIRNSSPSGIVSTTSGGYVRKIAVTWKGTNGSGRKLIVFGKNTAYTGPSQLYNTETSGDTLGIITYGTSTELVISDNYEFVGIKADGAAYFEPLKIVWEPIACPRPTNVAASNATPTSLKLSWTAVAAQTAWVVAYSTTTGFDPEDLTACTHVDADENPFIVTGLDPETQYYFRVKGDCGTDGESAWSAEATGTTLVACPTPEDLEATNITHTTADLTWTGYSDSYTVEYQTSAYTSIVFFEDFEGDVSGWTTQTEGEGPGWAPSTNYSHSASHSMTAYSYDFTNSAAYDADNWLISPQITMGKTLKFWAYQRYDDEYEVLFSTSNNISSFNTELQAMATVSSEQTWVEYTIDLTAIEGQTGYIAIHHVFNDGGWLSIDDFGIYGDEVPAGGWEEASTTAIDGAYTLEGLTVGTKYDVRVKGNCNGEYSDVYSFTTYSNNTKIFKTAGNWDVAGNWDGGIPTITNNAIIRANATVPADYDATANSITFEGTTTPTLTIKDGGQLHTNIEVTATVEKEIEGYTGAKDNYYLICPPNDWYYSVNPTAITGMLTGDYDLYGFDGTIEGAEWRNYEADVFNMEIGKGFLYANAADVTLKYTGTMYIQQTDGNYDYLNWNATNQAVDYLNFDESTNFGTFNLVGNTLPHNAYVYVGTEETTGFTPVQTYYYKMNDERNELVVSNHTIKPWEGVFVKATAADQYAIISSESLGDPALSKGMSLNLSQSDKAADIAIVNFGRGEGLEKFQLNPSHTKLYIPQNGKDYAVVNAEAKGEMPVNFKAAENGTYTIDFSMENVEFNYLHLIDNKTGANVDLLANPSYSFEAKTTDYASRFRLLFNANNVNDNENEDFAFVSDGNIVITNQGEATLQVIDMLGRIVSTQTVNGNATINAMNANGVYVLRLINGNNVKVQKIVVK